MIQTDSQIAYPGRVSRHEGDSVPRGRDAWNISDDQLLVTSVLSGDSTAAEAFVERYGGFVYAVLRAASLSPDEIEDLFQQVFVHLWEQDHRRLRQWQARGAGRFSSYLAVLTARLACDYRRARAVHTRTNRPDNEEGKEIWRGTPSHTPDLAEGMHRRQQMEAVRRALKRLNDRDALLITLRLVEGNSYRQISSALGMTVNHVGVALTRAEGRLRRELLSACPGFFLESS
jgi:RNA polymerase sigma-70 factor (ECF subfamily)